MQLVSTGIDKSRHLRSAEAVVIVLGCAALAMGMGAAAAFVLLPASANVDLTEAHGGGSNDYFLGISVVWFVVAFGSALAALLAWSRLKAQGGSVAQQYSALLLLSAGPVLAFLALPWTTIGADIYRLDPTFSLEGPVAFVPSLYLIGTAATFGGLIVTFGGERTSR